MTEIAPTKVRVGLTFDRLTVVALDRTDQHWRKYWLCLCDCGKEVSVRGDHLLRSGPATRSCGCLNRDQAADKGRASKGRQGWHKPVVNYRSAHGRVTLRRGRASDYLCPCGQRAEDWAYDHEDSSEHKSPSGLAYSMDPQHYKPMCKPCHARFDYARRYRRSA